MIAFLVIILVAAFVLYAVIMNTGRGQSGKTQGGRSAGVKPLDREDITRRWEHIMATSQTGGSGLKSAINEADKLLDHVMKQQGFAGATMADRLRVAQSRFTHRNNVWRAHKLRNALAHEVGFDLIAAQAKEALNDFERALKDLGALR